MSIQETVEANLARVKAEIRSACEKSGREASDVRLVAVTKYAELDWVRALIRAGHTELGESRPQQLARRAEDLRSDIPGAEESSPELVWHLIGHLQRNKVDLVLPVATLIHSVDSVRLVRKINSSAETHGVRPKILLEINVSGEEAKDGFAPEELLAGWEEIRELGHVDIQGVMTMAPRSDAPESARPIFRRLRELRDELVQRADGKLRLPELSMGMSGDFPVAVEEGATLVRLGSRLFEGLQS